MTTNFSPSNGSNPLKKRVLCIFFTAAALALGLALTGLRPVAAQGGPGSTPADGVGPKAAAPMGPGPIVPNRPGFTNGSATIAPGDALAENGLALSRAPSSTGGMTTLDYPQTNLRVGLTPALEADVSLPDYFHIRGGDSGFGDGAVGVKYRFYQSKNGNVKASAAPSLSLPTHSAFSSGQVDPTLLLGVQSASGARWNLASNLVFSDPTQNSSSSQDGNSRRVFTTTVSGSISYTLTPTLSAYFDAYDIAPRTGPPASAADGGFAYLISPNVQIDAEMYVGLGGTAPTRTLAAGLSFRL